MEMPGSFTGGDGPLDTIAEESAQAFPPVAPPIDPKILEALEQPSSFDIDTSDGADNDSLKDCGWGIIFPKRMPKDRTDSILAALKKLIDHREAEVADPSGALFKVFRDEEGYHPGDYASTWLKRRNVDFNIVTPQDGVPYYLLIVASPKDIPWEFQTGLDLAWAVGRIWFDTDDDFTRYAESVVASETSEAPLTQKKAAVFATHHGDPATTLLMQQLVLPLLDGTKAPDGRQKTPPLGQRQNFAVDRFLGGDATRDVLEGITKAELTGGTPALLFTGSHGRAPNYKSNPRYAELLGAPICQGWNGTDPAPGDCLFTADVLPANARVHGMIHFLFACFGLGSPQTDALDRSTIAWSDTLARLPQKLLAHENGGALAVFGHVGKAFPTSFQTDNNTPRINGIRMVLNNLMNGKRIGSATDQFNFGWGAQSTLLSQGGDDKADRLMKVQDARCFAVFGDPAVRLRI
jgi:hypothetical protein